MSVFTFLLFSPSFSHAHPTPRAAMAGERGVAQCGQGGGGGAALAGKDAGSSRQQRGRRSDGTMVSATRDEHGERRKGGNVMNQAGRKIRN